MSVRFDTIRKTSLMRFNLIVADWFTSLQILSGPLGKQKIFCSQTLQTIVCKAKASILLMLVLFKRYLSGAKGGSHWPFGL